MEGEPVCEGLDDLLAHLLGEIGTGPPVPGLAEGVALKAAALDAVQIKERFSHALTSPSDGVRPS